MKSSSCPVISSFSSHLRSVYFYLGRNVYENVLKCVKKDASYLKLLVYDFESIVGHAGVGARASFLRRSKYYCMQESERRVHFEIFKKCPRFCFLNIIVISGTVCDYLAYYPAIVVSDKYPRLYSCQTDTCNHELMQVYILIRVVTSLIFPLIISNFY